MSRIPTTPQRKTTSALPVKNSQPSTPSSSKPKEPSTSSGTAKTRLVPTTPSRIRTTSTAPKATPSRSRRASPEKAEQPPLPAAPQLSIKEAIALKRAEARKAAQRSPATQDNLEEAIPFQNQNQEEEDILNRGTVREAIERARNTGNLNLVSRTLPCLPSALFEIHLSIKPDPLKSIPDESQLPPSDGRAKRGDSAPAWYESQDLTVIKAWDNSIVEIQHEISMFGSLKHIDLHKNQLSSLPETFGDLIGLVTLDLSFNSLTSLPANVWVLPELVTLNISHNAFSSLPFTAAFDENGKTRDYRPDSFFAPAVSRGTTPLPSLFTLEASHNTISADSIDLALPKSVKKLDLSDNPLGDSIPFIEALAQLSALKELRMDRSRMSDNTLPSEPTSGFGQLKTLDLEGTQLTVDALRHYLKNLNQNITDISTSEEPPEGTLQLTVGKKIIREYWEVEAEKKAKARAATLTEPVDTWAIESQAPSEPRGRAAAAPSGVSAQKQPKPSIQPQRAVAKESWEIDAEQGLLTEGGRRRARALAAAAREEQASSGGDSPPRTTSPASALSNPQYYSQDQRTLTLPPSSVQSSKNQGHFRTFSLAPGALGSKPPTDIAVPTPTLPLAEIASQSFALTLKALKLVNRRLDKSFNIPTQIEPPCLPCLEELSLEGCNLGDVVPVSVNDQLSRTSESLLPLITKLFPSLRLLDLSYNELTTTSLTTDALSALILSTTQRNGLRVLRLRGNKIDALEGLQGVADSFRGNREVPGWKLEELDVRDNEIGKLPPELGLLPLDVFLVDGNVFRVPARRIWEREGTKGLLSWLRGRME